MNKTVTFIPLSVIPLGIVALFFRATIRTADLRLFQIGNVLLMVATTVFLVFIFGFLPENILTRNALRFGTLLELLFFSLALAMRIRTIEEERQHAEVRAETRTQFAATLSHEIRTPLTAIVGVAELMDDTPLNLQQTKYMRSLQSAASVLHALANDVLTFAKLDTEKMRVEQIVFSPAELLGKTGDIYQFKAAEKQISLKIENQISADLRLLGDPVKIGQILNNLTGNALKFTPENGSITIRAESAEIANKNTLKISVTDTGIGIPLEKQSRLFEAYTQADDSTARLYGGTGLGLSISSKLAKLMSGNLTCESAAGKGSTFTLTLYLASSKALAVPEQIDYARIIKNMPQALKILHVDDSPDLRMLFQFYFANTHHQIDSAETAEEGIELFKKHRHDFVFSDLHMPGIGGLAGLAQIKNYAQANNLRAHLVLTSGSIVNEDIAKLDVKILLKPVNTRDIYAAMIELGKFTATAG